MQLRRVAPKSRLHRNELRQQESCYRFRERCKPLADVIFLQMLLVLFCLACFFAACKQPAPVAPAANRSAEQVAAASPSPSPTPPRPSGPIEFTDVTAQAGIRFKHNSGAFGKKYLPETIGAGGAFLRLRQRRLAGHPARQFDGLARKQEAQIISRALSQQQRRHVHRRNAPGRSRRRDVRHRRRHRRLR